MRIPRRRRDHRTAGLLAFLAAAVEELELHDRIAASALPPGVFAAPSVAVSSVAADTGPTLLGSYKDWSAFQSVSRDGKSCYAMSQPKSSEPKKAKRDPIYFLISDWPLRKTRSEPEIVPGYQYKEGSTVSAAVGSDKFEFFTRNDGGAGSAWVKEQSDEVSFVEAMKRGSQVVVTGTSQHGTVTHDTYSLSGFSAALDKIHAACGM